MKKKVINNRLLLTSLMMWLLLLCSSRESMADEIISPKLRFNKEFIDICSNLTSERNFVITVDLGRAINSSDSLMLCEFVLYYSKGRVILDADPLFIGTLSEGFTYRTHQIDTESNLNYNKFIFGVSNITQPVSGNLPLVRISGRYLQGDIGCAAFFIAGLYFNEEFKINYITGSDVEYLCAKPRNLPDRRVNLYAENDIFHIKKLDDTLSIDYELSVANKKFLKSFTVEFAVSYESSDNIEISGFNINNEEVIKT